jgi:hypothetical protein
MNFLVHFFCLVFLCVGTASATDYVTSLHRRVSSLEDKTSEAKLIINSFPGVDEKEINSFALKNNFKKPFFITQVGSTYIVNPSKVTGYLWWKKVKMTRVETKVFESFLKDPQSESKNWDLFEEALK